MIELVKEEIASLVEELKKINEGLKEDPWLKKIYSSNDLMEMLQVKASTLRRYRDEGYLGYSKVGDKYFYTSDDVNRFLERSHNEPFAW